MESKTAQLKIHAISPRQESRTLKTTNAWHVLTVSEVPKNIYGHTPVEKPPFEVYVYNHNIENFNIENFNINQGIINEVGHFEIEIMFRKNQSGPSTPMFVVTDLTFKI